MPDKVPLHLLAAFSSVTVVIVKPRSDRNELVGEIGGEKIKGTKSASLPGMKPESFPWEMTCKAVALNSGASCSMKGTASIGVIEEACLLAYDPDGKAVHFMCVTSMAEVHDHKGQWINGREIRYEPYKTSWDGRPATEEVDFTFSDLHRIKTSSTITTEKGERMTFEFSGARE